MLDINTYFFSCKKPLHRETILTETVCQPQTPFQEPNIGYCAPEGALGARPLGVARKKCQEWHNRRLTARRPTCEAGVPTRTGQQGITTQTLRHWNKSWTRAATLYCSTQYFFLPLSLVIQECLVIMQHKPVILKDTTPSPSGVPF